MKGKPKTQSISRLQRLSQVVFFAIFISLMVIGRIQLWALILVTGIGGTYFFGRFYCGWICPIQTAILPLTAYKNKRGIQGLSYQPVQKHPWIRYSILFAFIALFAFTMVSGKKVPVLPSIFLLGVLMTLFFPEALWHRHLCPYGTLMHFVGKYAKRSMHIDADTCINCKRCQKVCPAEAIEATSQTHIIRKDECLVCLACSHACPKSAVSYGSD